MKKTSKMQTCPCEDIEFRVVWFSEGTDKVLYCPFCSAPLDDEMPEIDLEEDE